MPMRFLKTRFRCRAPARSGEGDETVQARRNDEASRRSDRPVRGGSPFPTLNVGGCASE